MGWINRLPRGLLSFVDTKTQGVNPAQLVETVAPILDMEPFYRSLVRYDHIDTENAAATPNGYAATVFVPTDEVWFVHSASWYVLNNSGGGMTNFRAYVNAFTSNTSGTFAPVTVLCGPLGSALAGSTISDSESAFQGQVFTRPFVLAPGWSVGLWLGNFAGPGNIGCSMTLTVNRMQV